MDDQPLTFGPFRLSGRNGPLLREGQEIRLQPKTLAVLWALARHGENVVTRDSLISMVWGDQPISDEALTYQVQTLRKALGDNPRSPRYVLTAHRVGFRMGVPVHVGIRGLSAPSSPLGTFIGRETELETLRRMFRQCELGQRQVAWIVGEAGIGKTALLDHCLTMLRAEQPRVTVSRGHCLESATTTEAYLPILEALRGAIREAASGSQTLELLRTVAPSWHALLIPPRSRQGRGGLHRNLLARRQASMQRELVDALEIISRDQPLIIAIEDLHTADTATIELLSVIAQRNQPARLLLLLTLRVSEAIISEHPVRTLQLRLNARGRSSDISLGLLDPIRVNSYLDARFTETKLPSSVREVIQARCGGHPLFLEQLTDYVRREGPDAEGLSQRLRETIPPSVQDLVTLMLMDLSNEEQLILQAGSVAGLEFSSGVVAAALDESEHDVENCLDKLCSHLSLVEPHGTEIWPDGRRFGRYRFRHVLYRVATRKGISEQRAARMHRAIAEELENAFAPNTDEIASELSTHYERAGIADRAIWFRIAAARRNQTRAATNDVLLDIHHGIALLARVPGGRERDQLELELRVIAASSIQSEFGFAASEAMPHIDRVAALLEQGDQLPLLEAALSCLWLARYFGGRIGEALHYARRTSRLGRNQGSWHLQSRGHAWASFSLQVLGEASAADDEAALGLTAAQVSIRSRPGAPLPEPGCASLNSRSMVRWHLGYPDQSLALARQAVAYAENLGGNVLCMTRVGALGNVLMARREWQAMLAAAEESISLSRHFAAHDAGLWAYRQKLVASLRLQPDRAELHELMAVLGEQHAANLRVSLPVDYLNAALAAIELGDLATARRSLDLAWSIIRTTHVRVWEPEALRIEGIYDLASGVDSSRGANPWFRRAYLLARERGNRSLQLRAVTWMASCTGDGPEAGEISGLLRELLQTFDGQEETLDLREAREAMTRLG